MPSKVPAHGNRSVNRSPCFPHRWCWDHEPSLLRRCLSRAGGGWAVQSASIPHQSSRPPGSPLLK